MCNTSISVKFYRSNVLLFALIGTLLSLFAPSFHYFIEEQSVSKNEQYMAIYPAKSTYVSYDESIMYWPKVTSILMGKGVNSADPYLLEHEQITTHIPSASESIVALLVEGLNMPVNTSAILIDLFFISVLFLMLYGFLHYISGKPLLSMLLALLFIFSFDLILLMASLPAIGGLINYFEIGNISLLSRTTNMSVSILPLVVFSFFYYQEFVIENKSKNNTNALFVASALLVYFNIYMWTFSIVVVFTTYFAMLLYEEKIILSVLIKKMIRPIFIYIIILLPFFALSYSSYGQDGYQEYLNRFGVAHTRSMHILTVGYIGLLIILHLLRKKYKNKLLLIAISFVISLFLVKNIQVLLGYTVQTFHWSRDAAIPLMLFLLIFHLVQIKTSKKFVSILFVIFFSLFQFSAFTYAEGNWKNHIASIEERGLYDYLNKNTKTDDVIATPWSISSSVLNYSKRKVYIPHAPVTFASSKEIISRLVDYYCAVNINSNNFEKLLSDKHAYYSIFHMDHVYHPATLSYYLSRNSLNLRGPYFTSLEKENMVKTLDKCKESIKSNDFIMRYHVNYIVAPDNLNVSKYLKQYQYTSIPGFKIYNIKAN
jgi:hypothetical protein